MPQLLPCPSREAPRITSMQFFAALRWIDGTPLLDHIEPYRRRIFATVLDTVEPDGRVRYNLALTGRAKKNWKSADLVLAALFRLVANPPRHGAQCYLLANDAGQAADNLVLAKKLIAVSPVLSERLAVKQTRIETRDRHGFLEVLPAQDVAGAHGKTYAFTGFDEIHGYPDWRLLEAMQIDPTRPDAQQWVTSYASLYHRPGVPLFDLCQQGRAGTDPRMFFSWYAGDYTTDPDFTDVDPETRANPSRGSWHDAHYLAQQAARLPAHQFRRLHLNLPGLPEGAAFQVGPIADAITRGVPVRGPQQGITYVAFVDMSGGSRADAALAIAHVDRDQRSVVDLVMTQGAPPPFDPRAAVARFARVLAEYAVRHVTGDAYGGETFRADFLRWGVVYEVSPLTRSQLYEALEPHLNARSVALPDVPALEQQLLGLTWRGGRIAARAGEHDDLANAVAGAVVSAGRRRPRIFEALARPRLALPPGFLERARARSSSA
jgi:hypothetical protein